MRTTTVHHYNGHVAVWVNGAHRFDAHVRLSRRDLLNEFETLAGTETVLDGTSWDGRFQGLAHGNLQGLQVAGEFELRLVTGTVGVAVLPNGRDLAYLHGLGDAPF